jgi:hypothetical protein
MSVRNIFSIIVLAVSGVTAVLAQPPTTTTRQVSFAPVGVALTETMQVNLLNQATAASNNSTAPSCTGSVSFLDATGKAIAGTGGNFTVASGQTQSLSILGTKANTSTTTGSRAEVRAVITLNVVHGTPCSLVDSLETFDSTTGATHVFLLGSILNEIPFPVSFGEK